MLGRHAALALALLSLAACAPEQRTISLEVTDAATGKPIRGAHVRAVPMKEGTVPLPLNDETLGEILILGKTHEQGFSDAAGRVRFTLEEGRPYLVSAQASPFSALDEGDGGDERGITLWELRADGKTLEPSDEVTGLPVEKRAVRLRLVP